MACREQEAYRWLSHPRLLSLLEAVAVEDRERPELDGAVALVTERAARSLADVIAQSEGKPVAEAPRLLSEICEGVAHMHESGWVHGDLKPANVLLMEDGAVRLADFGLSAELDGTHGYAPPAGTSDYLPPERWSEQLTERGTAIRESADIWALGVIACQLLTGHFPFPGPTARARAAAASAYAESGGSPFGTDGLSPQWRNLITDCLAPDHGTRKRWTAERLVKRLRELRRIPVRREGGPGERRRRWPLLAGSGALAVAVAGTTAAAILAAGRPAIAGDFRYLNPRAEIPARYRADIVTAGTADRERGVTPALVAAILKAESGFNARFSNPATKSYGIAGWTPAVLGYYLRPRVENPPLRTVMNPAISISGVGRYLCQWAPELSQVPGNHAINLAAAYQTADYVVVKDNGIPPEVASFAAEVKRYLAEYQPG